MAESEQLTKKIRKFGLELTLLLVEGSCKQLVDIKLFAADIRKWQQAFVKQVRACGYFDDEVARDIIKYVKASIR